MLIKNGLIFDAVHKGPYHADIIVRDGKIAAIGESSEVSALAVGDEEILDVSGKNVYPGLVEAHCHIGLDDYGIGAPGHDFNESTDPVTPHLRAIDSFNPQDMALRKALAAGVTTVCTGPGSSNVIGGTFIAVKTAGVCVDDMIISDPVAMKCAFGENPKNCYSGKSISARMTTAAKLREMLFKAKEYADKLDAAGDDASKRPGFDMKLNAMLPVIRGEIPLKAHAHRADDICTAIRIAKEFGVGLTLEHCTEGLLIIDVLKKAVFPAAVGPTMGGASKSELIAKSFSTPGVLASAGIPVSIITDSPVTAEEDLALCAGLAVRSGMDPFEALKAITINPARHIGVENRVGSIEIGKDADIVITDGDILSNLTHVEHVILDGKIKK